MKYIKKIRDPVHKDIYLSKDELQILDTPEMQRLRGIRQLGAAFYVYPGAHHSRFEHALGAYWMARKIIDALETYGGHCIPEEEKKAVHMAALIHDVTHIPYGHTFEDERKLMPRHDEDQQRYQQMIASGSLGRILRKSDAGRLAMKILKPSAKIETGKHYLREIVDGMICADLLDYLKRDNYFCGLSQLYDERLFHYFNIDKGHLSLTLHHNGIFRRDALSEITHLLRIRYVLSERVYYHHAKIAAGVMMSKAIERALQGGMQQEELYNLQDDSLPLYLEQSYGKDKHLLDLIGLFRARRLFKRCYMISREIGDENVEELETAYHHNKDRIRDDMEKQVAGRIGAGDHEVAIYCPSGKMALKEAQMPVMAGPHNVTRFCDLNSAEIQVLQQQHRSLWKFFVFVSPVYSQKRERVAKICEEVFGFENELPYA